MRTNFSHLNKFPSFYEMAIEAEKMLVETDYSLFEMKLIGNAMRQVAEGMVAIVNTQYFGEAKENFGSNIYTLSVNNVMDRESINNIRLLKEYGNACSHASGTISRSQICNMYEILYRETYKIVNYYLRDNVILDYKKSRKKQVKQHYNNNYKNVKKAHSYPNKKATNKTKEQGIGVIILTIVIIVFIALCYATSFI